MRSITSVLFLFLGVVIGPLAILTFLPRLNQVMLEPIIAFGMATFASGALAVTFVVLGTMGLHTLEEKRDAGKPK